MGNIKFDRLFSFFNSAPKWLMLWYSCYFIDTPTKSVLKNLKAINLTKLWKTIEKRSIESHQKLDQEGVKRL